MLGEGLRSGLQYLGIAHRTVCYLEREAYAAAVLAARMEEGSLDGAPIWPDLLTFDGAAWRGAVDCIAAGFPCQDLSLAGRRAGLDGARSGLFFNICDIADACGARFLFLENVAGIASATATVVDEAEGTLEERAAARVLGELADRGWNSEWLTLSASDVGASHGRARWFCWAWRDVGHPGRNAGSTEHREQSQIASGRPGEPGAACINGKLGDTGLQHQHLQQRPEGAEHSGAGQSVEHTTSARCEKPGWDGERKLSAQAGSGLYHRPEQPGAQLDNAVSIGRHTRRNDNGSNVGNVADTTSQQPGDVAHASSPGLPQRIGGGAAL